MFSCCELIYKNRKNIIYNPQNSGEKSILCDGNANDVKSWNFLIKLEIDHITQPFSVCPSEQKKNPKIQNPFQSLYSLLIPIYSPHLVPFYFRVLIYLYLFSNRNAKLPEHAHTVAMKELKVIELAYWFNFVSIR